MEMWWVEGEGCGRSEAWVREGWICSDVGGQRLGDVAG